MKELKNKLEYLLKNSGEDKSEIEAIMNEESIAPFDTANRLMAYLLSNGKMSYSTYKSLSDEYIKRYQQENKYISLFEMSPRTFGQTWGEQHIKSLFPEIVMATRNNLAGVYPGFDGEFDLWYEGIRIEVKACRANSANTEGRLADRAYSHEEAHLNNFKYHYQQLKPSCCDVFIWIGVCRDELLYWVLTSEELRKTGKLGPQHRNVMTDIAGAEVYEGQVFMTEDELRRFLVGEEDILAKVDEKGRNN